MSWEDDMRRQDTDEYNGAPWAHVAATVVGWLGLVGCLIVIASCCRGF